MTFIVTITVIVIQMALVAIDDYHDGALIQENKYIAFGIHMGIVVLFLMTYLFNIHRKAQYIESENW